MAWRASQGPVVRRPRKVPNYQFKSLNCFKTDQKVLNFCLKKPHEGPNDGHDGILHTLAFQTVARIQVLCKPVIQAASCCPPLCIAASSKAPKDAAQPQKKCGQGRNESLLGDLDGAMVGAMESKGMQKESKAQRCKLIDMYRMSEI